MKQLQGFKKYYGGSANDGLFGFQKRQSWPWTEYIAIVR